MKLTSLAYNLYDGTYDKASMSKVYEDKGIADMYSGRKRHALPKLPILLEYFGYV